MLRMSTSCGEPIILNGTLCAKQYFQTLVSVSAAFSWHADTWIFQPCRGSATLGW
jgi:hypothetical protein